MASELLTATLRHEFAISGKRWSGLIDPNVGARLQAVKFSTACNVGFDTATAKVLNLAGGELIPEGEAAGILYWWRFAVLHIFERGESAWVGRIWDIELGPLVDDPTLGRARTITIACQGIADDLTLMPAQVPGEFTAKDATTTLAGLIETAIGQQGSIIEPNFYQVGSTSIDIGQVSAEDGDYWLDLIVKALQIGDADGIEWTFLVFEPEDGPLLIPRGQGSPRWRYPALGAGVGVKWSGHEYASEVMSRYTNAASSAETTDPEHDDEAIMLHHNVTAGRAINVDGTSKAGAIAAAKTYLALHANPVAPTGTLDLAAGSGGYPEMPGPEGVLEPGWRVRAGQLLDLHGLLPSDNRWRHMRFHAIESTEYDDDAGTLRVTLDERRVRSRLTAQSVEIRRQWAALSPSRPRALVKAFETTSTDYAMTDAISVVTTIGVDGLMTFYLARDTELWISWFGLITPISATGRLTLVIALDGEPVDDGTEDARMVRANVYVASTTPLPLSGIYRRWITRGEHTLQLWGETASAQAGAVLAYARIKIEG